MKRWLPLGAFVGLALLLGVGLTLNPREVPSPFIGKPAPAFRLPALGDAATLRTPADWRGQVWVLNVWASWCAPCRDEHALLVQVAREQGAKGAPLLLVGLNYKDDARNADEWLRRLGNPYVATLRDADGRAAIDWGVYGVPETFVIDRAGTVRLKHVGPLTREVWARDVQPLLLRLQADPS